MRATDKPIFVIVRTTYVNMCVWVGVFVCVLCVLCVYCIMYVCMCVCVYCVYVCVYIVCVL